MSGSKLTRGDCVFCGRNLTKSGLSRHLKSCPARQQANDSAPKGRRGGQVQQLYHLLVQDAWGGDFWLHLEMDGQTRLDDLDYYLRAIWLECCGHLSQFSVGGWRGEEIPMSRRIEAVFKPGLVLTHIYDFGTSSETLVQLVDIREGRSLSSYPVYLMARNSMPEAACVVCGQPAGWYCVECLYEYEQWTLLCKKHAAEHPHNNYGEPMPLVNSPRVGLCGYDGPAEPPY
jgi:hypothetical protein